MLAWSVQGLPPIGFLLTVLYRTAAMGFVAQGATAVWERR